MQERLADEIADTLADGLEARGVLVVLEAEHACVQTRGVIRGRSSAVTVASRGELMNANSRAEVMSLIGGVRE